MVLLPYNAFGKHRPGVWVVLQGIVHTASEHVHVGCCAGFGSVCRVDMWSLWSVCVCSWLWAAVPAVGGRWRMTSPPQMDALGCCTPVARGCRCAALMVKLSPSSRSQTRAMVSPPTSVWAQMPSSSLISLPPAPSPPPATVRPLTRACASVFVMNRRAFLWPLFMCPQRWSWSTLWIWVSHGCRWSGIVYPQVKTVLHTHCRDYWCQILTTSGAELHYPYHTMPGKHPPTLFSCVTL